MKKNLTLFFYSVLLLFGNLSYAQLTSQNLDQSQGEKFSDFDLSKTIKTSKDFNQSKFTISQIDSVIEKIICEQKNLDVKDIEVPINYKKLKYRGYTSPQIVLPIAQNNSVPTLTQTCNIYSYDNLYISYKSNTLMDKYLVYYTIRAYLILKVKFPIIYQKLFVETERLPTDEINKLVEKNIDVPGYFNVTKNYFISFDNVSTLPTTRSILGNFEVNYFGNLSGIAIYNNTHGMFFNKTTIKNGGSAGERPIYSEQNSSLKLITYMKDGFIQALVHERLHDFIFQNSQLYKQLNYIRQGLGNLDTSYYYIEEPLVTNTTNFLFKQCETGISNDVNDFFTKVFNTQLANFKKSKYYIDGISKIKSHNPNLIVDAKDEDILILNIFDGKKTVGFNGSQDRQFIQQYIQQSSQEFSILSNNCNSNKRIQIQEQQMQQQQQQMQQIPHNNRIDYQRYDYIQQFQN